MLVFFCIRCYLIDFSDLFHFIAIVTAGSFLAVLLLICIYVSCLQSFCTRSAGERKIHARALLEDTLRAQKDRMASLLLDDSDPITKPIRPPTGKLSVIGSSYSSVSGLSRSVSRSISAEPTEKKPTSKTTEPSSTRPQALPVITIETSDLEIKRFQSEESYEGNESDIRKSASFSPQSSKTSPFSPVNRSSSSSSSRDSVISDVSVINEARITECAMPSGPDDIPDENVLIVKTKTKERSQRGRRSNRGRSSNRANSSVLSLPSSQVCEIKTAMPEKDLGTGS